ncbi:MAG TPA: sugar ABC transporter substrate-binding protein [Clostridiales bacterium]|nr:sugar ABC transporter substrate-binding protein [Clostridiales bacterium]
MKKVIQWTVILSLVLVAGFFGVVLKATLFDREDGVRDKLRITAIMPHTDQGYWSSVTEGILAAEKDYSDQVNVRVELPQLNYNVKQMTELVNRAVAAKVNAIIVQGIENEAYLAALQKAAEAGIQVIFVDTDIEDFVPHLYVGTNNLETGIMLGEKLAAVTQGKAKVAILSGEENYPNLEQRVTGLKKISAQYPDIKFLRLDYDNYDALTVMNKYNLIQEENPEIDTLICVEGTGGQTLGSFYAENPGEFSHILAFDYSEGTIQGIRTGMLDGIVIQDTHEMGYRAVEEALNLFLNGGYSANCIYTDVKWVTSSDLDEEGHYVP